MHLNSLSHTKEAVEKRPEEKTSLIEFLLMFNGLRNDDGVSNAAMKNANHRLKYRSEIPHSTNPSSRMYRVGLKRRHERVTET